MSIVVPVDELSDHLATYPWCLLITVSDLGESHVLAVPAVLVDGAYEAAVGRRALANASARPSVTLVFPPASGTEYSLIVDGRAVVADDRIRVVPTAAVLHRPALGGSTDDTPTAHCS